MQLTSRPVQTKSSLANPLASGSLVALALLIAEVMVSARAIELEEWSRGASTLVLLGVLGTLCGYLIGRTQVLDLISHLWALMVGISLSVLATAYAADELPLSFPGRVRFMGDLARVWLRESTSGRNADDDLLFIAALGLLVWLVGYAASWFLVRRGWILPALVLPGMLIVISVTNGGQGRTELAMMYVLLALALAAVQVSRLRAAAWHRAGLGFSTLAWRAGAVGGAAIAFLAVSLVWTAPIHPPDDMANAVADRLDGPMGAISDTWREMAERISPNRGGGSEFAQFDDQFEMGGALKLGNDPVALLQAEGPHYLAAQRYAEYDGRGWKSDPTGPGAQTGGVISPVWIAFEPNSQVYLPSGVVQNGAPVSASIKILKPTGPRLLTIETYLSSSEKASINTSWRQLNDREFDLSDPAKLPIELQTIAGLLISTTFTATADGEYEADDPRIQRAIEQERATLIGRYLQIRWVVDENGAATSLIANGWLPNYDDVDTIMADPVPGKDSTYSVTGIESGATADQLNGAGDAYPPYITSRYLQLPDSVTPETRQLARSVTNGDATPYEIANDIETYLRATYAYDENISGPSSGQDAVDYFLFQERRGYCEYFASAMVVMLRSLDVPARMVAGFREVLFDQEANGYLYTEKQAHTWVEVYFPGYGWIPFEPTPGVSPFDRAEAQPTVVPPTPTPEAIDPTPEATVEVLPTSTPSVAAAPIDDTNGDGGSSFGTIAAIAAGIVAVLGGGFLLYVTRLRGPAEAPGARLYRRLVRASRRAGVGASAMTTPRELAMRLGDSMPATRDDSDTIARLYRKELYGRQALTPDDRDLGERAWRNLRGVLSMRWFKRRVGRGKKRD
jgi:transglutaminase-like putative cysteine protease